MRWQFAMTDWRDHSIREEGMRAGSCHYVSLMY